MRKTLAIILAAALLTSLSSCGSKNDSSDEKSSASQSASDNSSASSSQSDPSDSNSSSGSESDLPDSSSSKSSSAKKKGNATPTKLKSKMSDYEKAYVKKRSFSLLDSDLPEPDIKIGKVIVTKETKIERYKEWAKKGYYTEEEAKKEIANAKDESYDCAMINGVPYSFIIPPKGYDGGKLVVGETTFNNKEEIYSEIEEYCKTNDYSTVMTENMLKQTKAVVESVINNTYTEMPDRYENVNSSHASTEPFDDQKRMWDYDRNELSAIKDKIEEYTVFDEQLGIEFLVHVTLPPNYDKNKTYPVFFMTDGIWRLKDHPALYKAMENGEADDTILVSLAYEYNINGASDQFRNSLLIANRDKLLDFITDDLMPYLCDTYNIDCADSTLLGHSMGGVFSHHALFNSDKYENQPFGKYIVGSPATFNLYNAVGEDYDAKGGETDYGYFDRHKTLDKRVWLCGGTLEDPDFQSYYNGHDSILTSLKKMNERLEAHNAEVTYKLYESHHSQYVSKMLLEYLKEEYPKN